MGIPEEELRLVLEDYQRGTNVATTPGTGLGLNLSRHIIELHGGELSIESEVGKGTTVGFTLPVSEHNTSQIPSPSSTTPLSEEDLQDTPGQIESDSPIPEKAKVLVVDDEPVNLEIIEDFLEELPLEITCYSSGDEFLNHLDEDEPDLMIVWGSGGTLRRMGEHLDLDLTLLGIDVQHGETVHHDLNEQKLIEVIGAHTNDGGPRPILLLLSPMGGQGFLIGRGNLQLSPDVLRLIGHANILGVATPSKLIGLEAVRIDTGEESLDAEFQTKRFIKILQGFRTTRLIRVAEL